VAVFNDVGRMEVWDRRQAGELHRSIGRSLGRTGASIRALVESTGGVRPLARKRCAEHLTLVDREEISRGLAHNKSLCEIAQRLGRAPSTVSREVGRNGGRDTYRAHQADRAAFRRARRPKPSKLSDNNPSTRMPSSNSNPPSASGLSQNWCRVFPALHAPVASSVLT
jgi:hypothetical protein